MKSRSRPTPSAKPSQAASKARRDAAGTTAAEPRETPAEPEPGADDASDATDAQPAPLERPMSERRRRRLAEQKRLEEEAQPRIETAEVTAPMDDSPPLVLPELAIPQPSPDAAPATWTAAQAPVAAPPRAIIAAPSGRGVYLTAGLAAALWAGGVASWGAFEIGSGGLALEPLRLALLALIALAPAGLALLLAHAVRQGAGLAAETRRARELSEALVAPTALAARETGEVLHGLKADIDQAALAAERARSDMALLRQALAEETARLNEAAESAGRTARRLAEQLGREREGLDVLGRTLDAQADGVIQAVERQAAMVGDASDLAQAQLREAEAALAARAADMAAAAGEAQDAARLASDDLARQTLRLENAGSGVAEQIQAVEEGLGQQRAALVSTALTLRTDQEDFSAQVESQRAQLTEQLSAVRAATGDLGQTAVGAEETLRDLVEAAADQFRALIDMSQREADGFDNATKIALDRFEALAADARDTLVEETRRALAALQATAEESRAAAASAADQAQFRADRLGEALFDAAQKADQAADARVESARRIVLESADLVDQAGEQTAQRLEQTLEHVSQALARIDSAMAELDERAARLPEQAQSRIEAMRAAVEGGLQALSAASHKAAEDTEALDAGFQERVRRNYEMLTETVRLMGVATGESAAARRRVSETPETGADEPRASATAPTPGLRPAQAPEGRGFGLRNRLGLASPPAPGPGPSTSPRAQPAAMDWSDLVGEGEAPLELDRPVLDAAEAQALTERITLSIRRMGVDPNALLPRARVQEAAEAVSAGQAGQARQIVRRVAPAAVRSVSRRVLSDPALQADAESYVREFSRALADYARAGDVAAVMNRLSSDGGRAFLLLDAAVGDLAG